MLKKIPKKIFVFVTFLLATSFISSCGSKAFDSLGGDSSTDPSQSSININNYSLSYINLAPQKMSGQWQRLIKVSGPVLEGIMVEKEHGPENWIYVGKTDSNGEFLDVNVAQDSRYRVGRKLLSGHLTGAFDQVLVGVEDKNKVIKAERVVIPPQGIFELQGHELRIETKELWIEGTIRAFDPASTGGQNAGSIVVRADTVRGTGSIDLRGQNGKPGTVPPVVPKNDDLSCANYNPNESQGSDRYRRSLHKVIIGKAGADGESGQDGGAGGFLRFEVASDLFSATRDLRILVSGGKKGAASLGAKGGEGGRMRFCKCWNAIDHNMIMHELSNWGAYPLGYCVDPSSHNFNPCSNEHANIRDLWCTRKGADGKDGSDGVDGRDGLFESVPLN